MQLTTNLPTCLIKDFVPKGVVGSPNRSSKIRDLIKDFFKNNFDAILSFTCKKPDLKVTSINLFDEERNLIEKLQCHRLFTSKAEAIRFILLHKYLNEFERLK